MTELGAHLARLARLEVELGVAETRALVVRAAVAAGVERLVRGRAPR